MQEREKWGYHFSVISLVFLRAFCKNKEAKNSCNTHQTSKCYDKIIGFHFWQVRNYAVYNKNHAVWNVYIHYKELNGYIEFALCYYFGNVDGK